VRELRPLRLLSAACIATPRVLVQVLHAMPKDAHVLLHGQAWTCARPGTAPRLPNHVVVLSLTIFLLFSVCCRLHRHPVDHEAGAAAMNYLPCAPPEPLRGKLSSNGGRLIAAGSAGGGQQRGCGVSSPTYLLFLLCTLLSGASPLLRWEHTGGYPSATYHTRTAVCTHSSCVCFAYLIPSCLLMCVLWGWAVPALVALCHPRAHLLGDAPMYLCCH
jgi:hypothetical protein